MSELKLFTDEQLLTLRSDVEQELERRAQSSEDVYSFFYSNLHDSFRTRFGYNQVESFKPWNVLPKTKRAIFIKAWNRAFIEMQKIGFTERLAINKVLLVSVQKSPIFDTNNVLSFDTIIKSLEQCVMLFDIAFPGYRGSSIKFLNEVLSNRE